MSDTVEFRHHCLTVPVVSPEDKVIDDISKLKQDLAATTSPNSTPQLIAIQNLQELFSKHKSQKQQTNFNDSTPNVSKNTSHDQSVADAQTPIVSSIQRSQSTNTKNHHAASVPRVQRLAVSVPRVKFS